MTTIDPEENPMPDLTDIRPDRQGDDSVTRTPDHTRPSNPAHKPRGGRTRNAQRPIGSKCQPDCRRPSQAQAHCSVCHITFGSVGGFDRHRDDGYCLLPTDLGMVERDGVWRKPMSDAERAAFDARMAVREALRD